MGSKILLPICLFLCFQQYLAINFGVPSSPDEFDVDGKLVFIQTVWRHGARTPTFTFPTDKNKWERGWGELTLEGMEQHVILGRRLYDRYVNTTGLIPSEYNSGRIYVRSTDVNRTILSAASNFVGFFKGVSGVDYPDSEKINWPNNYVPVPIHTPADFDYDYVGNPLRHCKRADAILKLMNDCPEILALVNNSKTLLDELSKLTGEKVTVWNVWSVYDAWFIDRENKKYLPPGFTDAKFQETANLNNKMDNFDYGIGIKPFKDFDIKSELIKLRGGPTLWSIIGHFQSKLYCIQTPYDKRDDPGKKLCRWIEGLDYYAYSAHDITIAGLFATFDFNETNFDQPGFPHYSACVSFELWQNPQSKYYIKVFYWVPPNNTKTWTGEDFFDITKDISGCNSEKCDYETFMKRSERYKLDDTPAKVCDNDKLFSGSGAFMNISSLFTISLAISVLCFIGWNL